MSIAPKTTADGDLPAAPSASRSTDRSTDRSTGRSMSGSNGTTTSNDGQRAASVTRPFGLPRDIGRSLSGMRHGAHDPTTRIGQQEFWHATITPDGPAVIYLAWPKNTTDATDGENLTIKSYGPGARWLEGYALDMIGEHDVPVDLPDAPDLVRRALKRRARTRLIATRNPYHQLLPVILAQRITAQEAIKQWHRLVRRHGTPVDFAPNCPTELTLPPDPMVLAKLPSWEFHRLGIEQSRARALIAVARHYTRITEWAEPSAPRPLVDSLVLIPGVGPWTAASVARVAAGDPDAVIVGDYHFPHAVVYHLTGRPRGTDDEMVALLEPYRGQRGRVQAALVGLGSAPSFGPRKRIIDVRHL